MTIKGAKNIVSAIILYIKGAEKFGKNCSFVAASNERHSSRDCPLLRGTLFYYTL